MSESSTIADALSEAVYDHLSKQGVVTREDVIQRFHQDEDALVRGVLRDLTESGLVFATGAGPRSVFRAASEEELGRMRQFTQGRIDELLWVIVYREGPIARSTLTKLVGSKAAEVDGAIDWSAPGGFARRPRRPRYRATGFVVAIGSNQAGKRARSLPCPRAHDLPGSSAMPSRPLRTPSAAARTRSPYGRGIRGGTRRGMLKRFREELITFGPRSMPTTNPRVCRETTSRSWSTEVSRSRNRAATNRFEKTHFGAMRSAPSSRIVSPFSIEFSTM